MIYLLIYLESWSQRLKTIDTRSLLCYIKETKDRFDSESSIYIIQIEDIIKNKHISSNRSFIII